MKRFVAIYLRSATTLAQWKATDDQKREELERAGMNAWMKWQKENEASILDHGPPLGKTKPINPEAISDTKNEITAYTIVQAESHEAAAKLFANHPYDLPGDLVEIMECLPTPSSAERPHLVAEPTVTAIFHDGAHCGFGKCSKLNVSSPGSFSGTPRRPPRLAVTALLVAVGAELGEAVRRPGIDLDFVRHASALQLP